MLLRVQPVVSKRDPKETEAFLFSTGPAELKTIILDMRAVSQLLLWKYDVFVSPHYALPFPFLGRDGRTGAPRAAG